MEYITYWSILETPSHTIKSNTITLILAISAGLCWVLIKKFKKDNNDGDRAILLWGTGIFMVLSTIMYFYLMFVYKDNSEIENAKLLDSPNVKKVEGIVYNFQRKYRRAKLGTETIESFSVDSVEFAYGNAVLGRFNSFAKTNNNFIFNGQQVRITYDYGSRYGKNLNTIFKIEVKQ